VKRRDTLRYLEDYGCKFLREGGNHTVYVNPSTKQTSTIPAAAGFWNELRAAAGRGM